MKFGTLLRVFSSSALILQSAVTGATTVSPMVVDIQTTGRGVVANVSVNNTGEGPLTMEAVAQSLQPDLMGLAASDAEAEDLLVVPPTALIPPGQTQTFRVQWIGDPQPDSSKHYYVGLNQIPVQLPEGQSAVQIVYNFNVLVNVGVTNGKPALALQSASIGEHEGKPAPSITVSNSGSTYGYLSQHAVRIVQTDASGKEVFNRTLAGNEFQQLVGYGLVATGQTRTMVLPIALPSATGTVTATLLDERGP